MIWFFDIDGTIIDNIDMFYQAWFKYAINRKIAWAAYNENAYGVKNIFEPLSPVDISDFEQSEEFADFYIGKSFPGAIKVIHKLIGRGDCVKLLTSRNPGYRLPVTRSIQKLFGDSLAPNRKTISLEVLTRKWAEVNMIDPDSIIFREDKVSVVSEFAGRCICVDDTPEKIDAFNNIGVTRIIKDARYNQNCAGPRFKDWSEFLKLADAMSASLMKLRDVEIQEAAKRDEEESSTERADNNGDKYSEVERALQAEAEATMKEMRKLKEELKAANEKNAELQEKLRASGNAQLQGLHVVGEVSPAISQLLDFEFFDSVYSERKALIADKIRREGKSVNTLKNMVGLMGLMGGFDLNDILRRQDERNKSASQVSNTPKAVEKEAVKDMKSYAAELKRLHDVFSKSSIDYAFVEESAGFIRDGEYQVGMSIKVLIPDAYFRTVNRVLKEEYGAANVGPLLAAHHGGSLVVMSGDIRIHVYSKYSIRERNQICCLFGYRTHDIYYIPCKEMREEFNGLYVTTEMFDKIVIDKFKELGYTID